MVWVDDYGRGAWDGKWKAEGEIWHVFWIGIVIPTWRLVSFFLRLDLENVTMYVVRSTRCDYIKIISFSKSLCKRGITSHVRLRFCIQTSSPWRLLKTHGWKIGEKKTLRMLIYNE